jgi:hypothetical protein
MSAVRVESTHSGHRLVAISSFNRGDIVIVLNGVECSSPNRFTIQIGPNLHLAPENLSEVSDKDTNCMWMYTNHSCSPNTVIRDRTLTALSAINPGDEITFDYETTEFEMAEPFECCCGSAECRRTIRGYRYMDPARYKKTELQPAACLSGGKPDSDNF